MSAIASARATPLTAEERAMVDAAIAEGRVTRCPAGAMAYPGGAPAISRNQAILARRMAAASRRKAAIARRYAAGMTCAQIAADTGIPEGSVAHVLRRLREEQTAEAEARALRAAHSGQVERNTYDGGPKRSCACRVHSSASATVTENDVGDENGR